MWTLNTDNILSVIRSPLTKDLNRCERCYLKGFTVSYDANEGLEETRQFLSSK